MKNNRSGGVGIAVLLFVAGVAMFAIFGIINVRANYVFSRDFLSTWNLAEKSSSIPAKSLLIGEFVGNLESNKNMFARNNAVFLPTPDNAFENNLKAVETLRDRLNEIKVMDPTSFQYNTAIQQITAQEQGEATGLLTTLCGCYMLSNYPLVWNWIGISWIMLGLLLCIVVIASYIVK